MEKSKAMQEFSFRYIKLTILALFLPGISLRKINNMLGNRKRGAVILNYVFIAVDSIFVLGAVELIVLAIVQSSPYNDLDIGISMAIIALCMRLISFVLLLLRRVDSAIQYEVLWENGFFEAEARTRQANELRRLEDLKQEALNRAEQAHARSGRATQRTEKPVSVILPDEEPLPSSSEPAATEPVAVPSPPPTQAQESVLPPKGRRLDL